MMFRHAATILGLSIGLGLAPATAQVGLSANDIVNSLQGIEAAGDSTNLVLARVFQAEGRPLGLDVAKRDLITGVVTTG